MTEQPVKFIEIEGNAGSLGAARIYMQHKSEIDSRFRNNYISLSDFESEADSSLPLLDNGIIGGLNRICAEEKCGYVLHLRRIPVLQKTIEVCELFPANPYELPCHARIILTDKKSPASCGYTTQALRKTLTRES
ncbi:MAG: hypothetical protein KBS51_02195 [Lachnospiraceae bacterium]|nr:hypothetical protein [Candidatus Darwinimomas equi]